MYPHQVIGPQQWQQLLGKQRIHGAVSLVLLFLVVKAVQEIVKQGPERAVGEAVVVLPEYRFRQTDRAEADVAALQVFRIRRLRTIRVGAAVPAEPQTAGGVHRRQQPDRQPAVSARPGQRHAVGHVDQPAQTSSSQRLLRRMAVVMIPTML